MLSVPWQLGLELLCVSVGGGAFPLTAHQRALVQADRTASEENMRGVSEELRDLIQVSEAAARMERSEGRR